MSLPRVDFIEFLKENKGYDILARRVDTMILKLANGDIVKVLDPDLLDILDDTEFGLEDRLDMVDSLTKFSNFPWPTKMLDANGIINGYVMDYVPGMDFTDYYQDTLNLSSYADIHSQIEKDIKDGNSVGIVFPDLCTTENIRITPDGKVVFIDFDGLQIKHMPAVGYSDFLGLPEEVLTPKYYDPKTNLLSSELDIKSAIFLYFVDVFGINLASVNRVDPKTGRKITLDDIFSLINLDDVDIQHKVWKLFQESSSNEFLGEDLYRMNEKYRLVEPYLASPIKILVKR